MAYLSASSLTPTPPHPAKPSGETEAYPATGIQKWKGGFTLVEISIVLVIIGLLTGGVLLGRDLIRQARLQKVISEVDKLKIAVHLYKDLYHEFPGDHSNAQRYFGAAACPNPCNGNGNGFVGHSTGEVEQVYVYKHLSLSKLLEDRGYSTNYTHPVNRVFHPSGAVDGGYFRFMAHESVTAYTKLANAFLFTSDASSSGAGTFTGILSPYDALFIDTKIDDGRPRKGNVWGFDGSDQAAFACSPGGGNPAYAISTNAAKACRLYFVYE